MQAGSANARYSASVLAASPSPHLNSSTSTLLISSFLLVRSCSALTCSPRFNICCEPEHQRSLADRLTMDIIASDATLPFPRPFETPSRTDTLKPKTSAPKGRSSSIHTCGTCFRTFSRREHRIRHERGRRFLIFERSGLHTEILQTLGISQAGLLTCIL